MLDAELGLGAGHTTRWDSPRTARDLVVIGGSAGSAAALRRMLPRLSSTTSASIFVVVHRSAGPWYQDALAEVLRDATPIPINSATDQQSIQGGCIYICPPDQHMELENGVIRIDRSPKENHTRPSIDVLFKSAAIAYGRRVVGVLVSGALKDGSAGLWQIKRRGGVALVQQPFDAEYPSIPSHAIDTVAVDYVLSAEGIGDKLAELLCASSVDPQPIKVLIVEDEGIVAQDIADGLTLLQYEVSGIATTGEEAIDQAIGQGPDVILMDIRLAGPMSGIEAARRIWERLQVPVVFVTANADVKTLSEVKATENYGYVLKPLQTSAVHAAIQLALDRREKELRHSVV